MSASLPPTTMKNLVIPGVVGNILEWYDFSLYGYLAPIIAHLFFPTHDKNTSIIATFGVFAVGFLMRPLGAVIFGHLGDKLGRKKTLAASVILMAVPTVLIGLLPTYAQIGIWAGILLTVCRLLQGLAVGGEFAGSIVYIIEHAPNNKRGLFGSWAMFSAFAGLLLGSGVGTLITHFTVGTHYAEIAWRFPFLLGIILGGVGLYLRLRMPETPNFTALQQKNLIVKSPLITALRQHPILMIKAMLLDFLPAMGFYLLFVYLSSYFTLYLKIPLQTALLINTISMTVIILLIPLFGKLSDKVGRRLVLGLGALTTFAAAYPLFLLMQHGTFSAILAAQIIFAFLISFCYAPIPAALTEMFHTNVRYTAMALPYNLANAIFGGTAPLVATYLISKTNNIMMPAFYLMFAAMVMVLVTISIKETYKKLLS